MSLGLFVLGTFANSDPPKAMYKRLPLSFKDNGELRCPGSKIKGPRKDLLTKNLLNRFGITVATRFQVICCLLTLMKYYIVRSNQTHFFNWVGSASNIRFGSGQVGLKCRAAMRSKTAKTAVLPDKHQPWNGLRFNTQFFFQDDPTREDSCIYFWVCSGFHTDSISIRGSCPFPQVFEPSKEKCVFYT